MARWTKNHMLELGIVLLLIGLAGTIVSFTLNWADAVPGWLTSYANLMRGSGQGDFNLLVLIAAPILLIWGAFWVGEQIILRRRFQRMIDTPKKSEFSARRSDIEDVLKRLPDGYKTRLKEKESEFVSKRA